MRKKVFSALSVIFFLTVVFFSSITPAFAANQPDKWKGVCVAEDIVDGEDVATLQGFECLIGNVFSIIITVIGLAGFVMFIIGSFRYMLSGNDSKGVETAKNTMTFAIIGIVVALSGFIILNLIASFTGISSILQFKVPSSSTGFPPPASNRNLTPI